MMRICAAILVGLAGLLLLATFIVVSVDLWKEHQIRAGLRAPTKEEWKQWKGRY